MKVRIKLEEGWTTFGPNTDKSHAHNSLKWLKNLREIDIVDLGDEITLLGLFPQGHIT